MSPARFLAAVAAAAAATGLVAPRVLDGPTFVDELSIVNGSEYDVHVEVSDAGRRGWMSVTTATRQSTTSARAVIDQGPTWVFRFGTQGRRSGEVRITSAELRQAGWAVQVPDAVIEGFRRQGAPPSP